MPTPASAIRHGSTMLTDAQAAVDDLYRQLVQDEMAGVLFFCSSEYDLTALQQAMAQRFGDTLVMGSTSAGEIDTHYQRSGISGLSFAKQQFALHSAFVENSKLFSMADAEQLVSDIRQQLCFNSRLNPEKMFGFLMVDGLNLSEEIVTAYLYSALDGIPMIGGSAGDDLKFESTQLYHQGHFYSGAAHLLLVESKLPFETFQSQHFEPTETSFIVTEATPAERTVQEINAIPAAEAYASFLGLTVDQLEPGIFSQHPIMLRFNQQWHIRSIQKVLDDGSLKFYCAIEDGLPMTLGRSRTFTDTLEQLVEQIEAKFSTIALTLGCDCILRKLAFLELNESDQQRVEALLKRIRMVGFNTYGEQFNGLHVNQTLTGVVIGTPHDG
uniref:Putative FIST N domain and FIST C domain containing signal transduction protein n=1 Tax=Magnetococcus massalia (strain MO-1) TaxID=451514 RepID=A0A1S7LCZ6_MAGMO|nr:Putative FIST N domain and FIST C domain containing signal transduction protein [Candidatus Magnetococcus massalia]